MIRQHTVDLLRHPTIETSQPGFYVGNWNRKLCSSQRASQRGVRVAIDQDIARALAEQHTFDSLQHLAGLDAMRTRTDTEVHSGLGQVKSLKENAGHFVVIMLSGVDQHFFMPV